MAAKKNPERTRAKGAELELRIDAAEEILLVGATDRKAEKSLMTRFGVSRRTASRYVAKVYERWAERARQSDERTVEQKRQQHEEMIKGVMLRAAQRENLPLQLRSVELLMKLTGTNEVSRIELSGSGGGPINFSHLSDEELKRLVSEANVSE